MSGVPVLFAAAMSPTAQAVWVVLWLLLVTLLVVALVVLALSRWGRSQPVRICVVLSLLAHVLLAGYAATIQIFAAVNPGSHEPTIEVSILDDQGENKEPLARQQLWDKFAATPAPVAEVAELPQVPTTPAETIPHVDEGAPDLLEPQKSDVPPVPNPTVDESPLGRLPLAEIAPAPRPEAIEVPAPAKSEAAATAAPPLAGPERVAADVPSTAALDQSTLGQLPDLLPTLNELPSAADRASARRDDRDQPAPSVEAIPAPSIANDATATGQSAPSGNAEKAEPSKGGQPSAQVAAQRSLPEPYRLRIDAERTKAANRRGGSPEAEAAVQAGLRWLAAAQSEDGHWDAARFGAGRELRIDGSDRQGAGSTADTAMTGLAILAFQGAGHTHLAGAYQDNVRRGLEYLLSIQRADGSLAGRARLYEAMYCHGMASFALSEAYAMTADTRLQPGVARAVSFIIASQHPTTGGWRYQPGDPGDTSQLGWQVMALRSAELAGTPMPQRTRDGVARFLGSVASGRHGGLASYRPGAAPTRTMTAEALASRQFLGLVGQDATTREAAEYLMGQLPGEGQPNLYYWYYAALSLHQLQDEHWTKWNQAMQRTLVASQRREGEMAGSWDTDTVWGGYGGRVYTTAMATLCLEVYYRYLPVYSAHGDAGKVAR